MCDQCEQEAGTKGGSEKHLQRRHGDLKEIIIQLPKT